MTRREMFSAAVLAIFSEVALRVPVRQVFDGRAKCTPEQLRRFATSIWPEAVRDFRRCGIQLETKQVTGEVRRSPAGRPIFVGLERGVVNLVVTDSIPLDWDSGRGLTGVTTRYEEYHLCMIALNSAHGHQIPFFSVNTCVHELLHVLLHDVFEPRPRGLQGEGREFRVDLYATRLWLFHDGAMIRKATRAYLDRVLAKKL
jgi:hypothetical protein